MLYKIIFHVLFLWSLRNWLMYTAIAYMIHFWGETEDVGLSFLLTFGPIIIHIIMYIYFAYQFHFKAKGKKGIIIYLFAVFFIQLAFFMWKM